MATQSIKAPIVEWLNAIPDKLLREKALINHQLRPLWEYSHATSLSDALSRAFDWKGDVEWHSLYNDLVDKDQGILPIPKCVLDIQDPRLRDLLTERMRKQPIPYLLQTDYDSITTLADAVLKLTSWSSSAELMGLAPWGVMFLLFSDPKDFRKRHGNYHENTAGYWATQLDTDFDILGVLGQLHEQDTVNATCNSRAEAINSFSWSCSLYSSYWAERYEFYSRTDREASAKSQPVEVYSIPPPPPDKDRYITGVDPVSVPIPPPPVLHPDSEHPIDASLYHPVKKTSLKQED